MENNLNTDLSNKDSSWSFYSMGASLYECAGEYAAYAKETAGEGAGSLYTYVAETQVAKTLSGTYELVGQSAVEGSEVAGHVYTEAKAAAKESAVESSKKLFEIVDDELTKAVKASGAKMVTTSVSRVSSYVMQSFMGSEAEAPAAEELAQSTLQETLEATAADLKKNIVTRICTEIDSTPDMGAALARILAYEPKVIQENPTFLKAPYEEAKLQIANAYFDTQIAKHADKSNKDELNKALIETVVENKEISQELRLKCIAKFKDLLPVAAFGEISIKALS